VHAVPTALNLSRTISTLDDVQTWIRDVATFNGGWCIAPELMGADVGETINGTWVRTFTDEEASAYDLLWLASWRLMVDAGFDMSEIVHEINPSPNVIVPHINL
jgi:hypothetical protein